jgi:hypothetical protein
MYRTFHTSRARLRHAGRPTSEEMPMPERALADLRAALDTYRTRNPEAYEELAEYARCLADELQRLTGEERELTPDDLEEMFTDPPDYDCADTQGVVYFMLGYVQGAAAVLASSPWEIVRAVVVR